MLEYFGVKGAETCEKAAEAMESAKVLDLDRDRGMPLVRRIRILSCLNITTATPLNVIYTSSKASYGSMKELLIGLEGEGLVSSKLYVRGSSKLVTKQYLITQKGLDYVKQYDTEDGRRILGSRKGGAARTGKGV